MAVKDNSRIQIAVLPLYEYAVLSLAHPSTWDLPHEMTESIMHHT
jgi:hypothetical protein